MTSMFETEVAVPLAISGLDSRNLGVSFRRASSQVRVRALLLIAAIHGVTRRGL